MISPTPSWDVHSPMPTARYSLSAVSHNGKIYAFGGYAGGTSNKLEIYDIESNTWGVGANCLSNSESFTANGFGDKIYVIGGSTSKFRFDVYDILTNSWSSKTDLLEARYAHTSEIVGDKIYVMGGVHDSSRDYRLDIYDITNDTWSTGANIPVKKRVHGSAVVGTNIYIMGGANGTMMELQIYDTLTDTWSSGASMPKAAMYLSAKAVGNKIYVFGDANKLHIYDVISNIWYFGLDLSFNSFKSTTALAGNSIYILGGVTDVVLNINESYRIPVDNTLTIQHKRGPDTLVNAYQGEVGELIVNTTDSSLHLMDGVTPGGHKIKTGPSLSFMSYTADVGTDLWVHDSLLSTYTTSVIHNLNLSIDRINISFYNGLKSVYFDYEILDDNSIKIYSDSTPIIKVIINGVR